MVRLPYRNPHPYVKMLVVGAHPDDADLMCGGTAIRLIGAGGQVAFISMTDGSAGHHQLAGAALVRRRREEAQAAGRLLGLSYRVLHNPDGGLTDAIEPRNQLISILREFQPSLIVTHRPNDYHTDHRRTSLLVQDATYLVAVPNICPTAPALSYNPIVLYAADKFRKPLPFHPDILVDITEVYEKKLQAMACHESQFFEWLPFVQRIDEPPPAGFSERLLWLDRYWGQRTHLPRWREYLAPRLTPMEIERIRHLEGFEACEYGGLLDARTAAELLPFAISLFVPQTTTVHS
jgi:LmbE family N-acetylglucosaminyl deacetylase